MKKLFIVTSNPTEDEQDKLFQEWLEPRFVWWHWLNQTWLLVDEDGIYQAKDIRDNLLLCSPRTRMLVLEFREDGTNTWSGYGPRSETDTQNNMFSWIKENFKF
jgi:hypothetical protein